MSTYTTKASPSRLEWTKKISDEPNAGLEQNLNTKALVKTGWEVQKLPAPRSNLKSLNLELLTKQSEPSEIIYEDETVPDTLYIDLGFVLRELFFEPYSIFESKVFVGEVRKKAAETFGGLHTDSVLMYYHGNELIDDELPVRHYGCRQYSCIRIQVAEGQPISTGLLLTSGDETLKPTLPQQNQPENPQDIHDDAEKGKEFVDSAYGTATHDMSASSQPTQSITNNEIQSETLDSAPGNINDKLDDKDEIGSVVSDDEDIQSQIDTKYSRIVQEAEKQLHLLFLEDPTFYRLCKELKDRTTVEKFSTSIRRLLKPYYRAQRELAQTRLEHAAISLLRSRNSRRRIATLTANGIEIASKNTDWDALAAMKDPGGRSRVESWLGSNPAFTLRKPLHAELGIDEDLISGEDSEQDEVLENVHIRAVEVFLVESEAFQKLLCDIQVAVMPNEVKPFVQTLSSIPAQDIKFRPLRVRPLLHSWQEQIEGWTGLKLPWVDRNLYRSGLATGHTRVSWRCYCNRRLSADISSAQVKHLQDLLALKKNNVFGSNLCQTVFQPMEKRSIGDLFPLPSGSFEPKSLTTDSSSQSTGRPDLKSSNRQQSSSRSSDSTTSSTTSDSTSPSSQSTALSLTSSATSPSPSVIDVRINDRYVLLGIKGQRRTPEVLHIDTKSSNNDRKFFSEARRLYSSTRGLLRRTFAIWQLSHCSFVKFQKHLPNRTRAVALELPLDEEEYLYKPRPPEANPKTQIDDHIWPVLLSTPCCETRLGRYFGMCVFQWMHEWIHDCVPALKPDTTDLLDRIPQKKSRWLLETDGTDEAWGLHATDTISAHHVVVYHLLILFGPFIFWMMWPQTSGSQEGASIDLQNASVPLMIAIGLMSMSASVWTAIQPTSGIENR